MSKKKKKNSLVAIMSRLFSLTFNTGTILLGASQIVLFHVHYGPRSNEVLSPLTFTVAYSITCGV